MDTEAGLKKTLLEIEAFDSTKDYDSRNEAIHEAMAYAYLIGLPVGVRFDSAEPEWTVVYIELPTGQVSWHLPQHEKPYDGHTTEEKYRRIREYV